MSTKINRAELEDALAESILEDMDWNTLYHLAYNALTEKYSQMPEDALINAIRLDAPHLLDEEN
jgi:hypothetical protein